MGFSLQCAVRCPPKQFAQPLASSVQLRLRISDRASQNSGNLLMLVTFDIMKNEGRLTARWQEVDRRLEVDAVKQAREVQIGLAELAERFAVFGISADLIERFGLRDFAAEAHQNEVGR